MSSLDDTNLQSHSTIQWIGDISLNGLYCDPMNGCALAENMAQVVEKLGPCSLRIANWEAPLWGTGGVNHLKQPHICTTRRAAESVLPLGLDVALLANNHVYDCLADGFHATLDFLDSNHIKWLGAGRSSEEAASPLEIEFSGGKLALLNYVGAETNPCLPADCPIHLNMLTEDRACAEIRSLSRCVDVIAVAVHWGAIELLPYPNCVQRRLARSCIEAGASVVVGHHAHCLQSHEPYGDGYIFYGLGNFLFDRRYGGETRRQWPGIARAVGVATTELRGRSVVRATLSHFRQEGLYLRGDDSPRRRRRERKLNRALRLTDAALNRLITRELVWQWTVRAPVRFLLESGGPLSALRRLRPDHFQAFKKALLGRWERTSR
jgi:poly-gamma-glutamate synthesis protein (capsule biosynthesis protein)